MLLIILEEKSLQVKHLLKLKFCLGVKAIRISLSYSFVLLQFFTTKKNS